MAGTSVTGFTAERSLEIEQSTITSGFIQGDSLILKARNGTEIVAGNVRGIQGVKGDLGGVPDATSSAKGGIRLSGNIGGSADAPTIKGMLNGTVDASLAIVSAPNNEGWGGGDPSGISMNLRQLLNQVMKTMYDMQKVILRSNRTTTLWSGSMAEYINVPLAERSAPGFIAVIIE